MIRRRVAQTVEMIRRSGRAGHEAGFHGFLSVAECAKRSMHMIALVHLTKLYSQSVDVRRLKCFTSPKVEDRISCLTIA